MRLLVASVREDINNHYNLTKGLQNNKKKDQIIPTRQPNASCFNFFSSAQNFEIL